MGRVLGVLVLLNFWVRVLGVLFLLHFLKKNLGRVLGVFRVCSRPRKASRE